jgi:hypothetical protein
MKKLVYALLLPLISGSMLGAGAVHLRAQEARLEPAQLLIPPGKEAELIKSLSKKTQGECNNNPDLQSCTQGCSQQYNIAVTYCNANPQTNTVCIANAVHNLNICAATCTRNYCT